MKPIGPLMREHRLIERMANLLTKRLQMAEEVPLEPILITLAVDFFQTYAEHTHFSKEEDFLFHKLAEKPLTPDLERIMRELVEEHILFRQMSQALHLASQHYAPSDPITLNLVLAPIKDLTALYPSHMEKEDKQFFFQCLDYLSPEEQNAMLAEFAEFDRKVVHEIYLKAVEGAEQLSKDTLIS